MKYSKIFENHHFLNFWNRDFRKYLKFKEMSKLSQKFFKAIEEKNSTLINDYLYEIQNQFNILNTNPNNEMNDEETKDFDIRSDGLIDEVFKAKAQKREISDAANGKKPDIYHEFVKDICSKTVN